MNDSIFSKMFAIIDDAVNESNRKNQTISNDSLIDLAYIFIFKRMYCLLLGQVCDDVITVIDSDILYYEPVKFIKDKKTDKIVHVICWGFMRYLLSGVYKPNMIALDETYICTNDVEDVPNKTFEVVDLSESLYKSVDKIKYTQLQLHVLINLYVAADHAIQHYKIWKKTGDLDPNHNQFKCILTYDINHDLSLY